jgi:hypothetical protein
MADNLDDELDLYDDSNSDSSQGSSGGGGSQRVIILIVLLLASAGGYYYFNVMKVEDDFAFDLDEDTFKEDTFSSEEPKELYQEPLEDPEAVTDSIVQEAQEVQQTQHLGTGNYAQLSPRDGAVVTYDESRNPPGFKWTGGQGQLVFSRKADMSRVQKSLVAPSGVRVSRLYPGTWYWQVKGAESSSSIRSLVVKSSRKRNIVLQSPQGGESLPSSGGEVRWIGDERIAYYKIELIKPETAVTAYRFATSGTSLQIKNVESGSYQLRVGGFSEVSSKWEFSDAINITVD